MVRIWNKQTGESRLVDPSDVRLLMLTGNWSQVPVAPTSQEGTSDPDTDPILQARQEQEEEAVGGFGRNLTAAQILGLFDDGILAYEAALGALQAAGLRPDEAEMLLVGQGPQAQGAVWQDVVAANLLDVLAAGAKEAGFADPKSYAEGFLSYYWDDMQRALFRTDLIQPHDPNDPNVIRSFIDSGRRWLQTKWGFGKLPSGGSTGGGRGAARTTAEMFDIDQLTDKINESWRSFTLSDAPNARELARQYVAQVAGNPSQALDFNTWVKNRMRNTPEWNFVFRNKPAGVSEEDYIRFYASSVFNVLGPSGDAPTVARNAAAFGASPDALEGRLRFHPTVSRSSGFIGKVEESYRSIRDLLGGFK